MREIQRAYRIRVYPNKAQEDHLVQTIGACRFVYNYFLDRRAEHYVATQDTLTLSEMSKELAELRRSTEWMQGIQFVPLQQSLRKLVTAYDNYLLHNKQHPRYKSRKDARQSFEKPAAWSIAGNKLRIEKNMYVRFRGTIPPADANTGTLTLSRTATGKWFASITCTEVAEAELPLTAGVGIDVGLTHLAILSDGGKFTNRHFHKDQLKRLKALHQSVSRKQKGSTRREKARLHLALAYEKIFNQRRDYLHKVSSAITSKSHALIAVEDLSVSNMLKNRHLSRSISDVAWSELIRQIEYKQRWRGGQFVKISRWFPSSKTCSSCGTVKDKLALSERYWRCVCGAIHDRDINAAKNILKQAEAQFGVESTKGSPLGESYRLSEARSIA